MPWDGETSTTAEGTWKEVWAHRRSKKTLLGEGRKRGRLPKEYRSLHRRGFTEGGDMGIEAPLAQGYR